MPGVINDASLGTFIACTNTLGSTVTMGVEVFGEAGGAALNNASATSLDVAPGETVLSATQTSAAFVPDVVLVTVPVINKGSARVLVTASSKASQQILCTAFLANTLANPPVSMTSLNVIRRNTQQGE